MVLVRMITGNLRHHLTGAECKSSNKKTSGGLALVWFCEVQSFLLLLLSHGSSVEISPHYHRLELACVKPVMCTLASSMLHAQQSPEHAAERGAVSAADEQHSPAE